MQILYYREYLKNNPTDSSAKVQLEKLKLEFRRMAETAGYYD